MPVRLAAFGFAMLAFVACGESGFPYGAVVEAAGKSVVRITVQRQDGTLGLASGFYVDDVGTVMTADHVVYDPAGDRDVSLIVATSSDQVNTQYRIWLHLADLRSVLLTPLPSEPAG